MTMSPLLAALHGHSMQQSTEMLSPRGAPEDLAGQTTVAVLPPGATAKGALELTVPSIATCGHLRELALARCRRDGCWPVDAAPALGAAPALVVPASRERPVVGDALPVGRLAADSDSKKEKGAPAVVLALFGAAQVCEAQYLAALDLAMSTQVVLDGAAPLHTDEWVLSRRLAKDEEFALMHVCTATGAMRWLNANFSLRAQGFDAGTAGGAGTAGAVSGAGSHTRLVVVPVARLMHTGARDAGARDAETRSGYLVRVKERELLRPGLLVRTSYVPSALGMTEKNRLWFVAADKFLLAYSDRNAGAPESVVLLDHYHVSLGTLVSGQLCIILRPVPQYPFDFAKPRAHILLARSDSATRQWFRTLAAKSACNSATALFARPLAEIVARTRPPALVPAFVRHACATLFVRAIDNSQLFTAVPTARTLEAMRDTVDAGGLPVPRDTGDDVALAQLLTSFLAEMPEGLLPGTLMPELWSYFRACPDSARVDPKHLRAVLAPLPPANAATLRLLVHFFAYWAQESSPLEAPAAILGPLLLRLPDDDKSTSIYKPALMFDVSVKIAADMLACVDDPDILPCPPADSEDALLLLGSSSSSSSTAAPPPPAPVVPVTVLSAAEQQTVLAAVRNAHPFPFCESDSRGAGAVRRQTSTLQSSAPHLRSSASSSSSSSSSSSRSSRRLTFGSSRLAPLSSEVAAIAAASAATPSPLQQQSKPVPAPAKPVARTPTPDMLDNALLLAELTPSPPSMSSPTSTSAAPQQTQQTALLQMMSEAGSLPMMPLSPQTAPPSANVPLAAVSSATSPQQPQQLQLQPQPCVARSGRLRFNIDLDDT